jgi:hypothetical protein
MNKRIYILLILAMLTGSIFGQFIGRDNLSVSLFYFQKTELDSAKKYVDLAVLDEGLATQAKTWYYRGYIYKDLYKTKEKENAASPYRLVSIASFEKMMISEGKETYLSNANKMLSFQASTLYNDAARMLDSASYSLAKSNFESYKKTVLLVDSSVNVSERVIKFKLAFASKLNGSGKVDVELDSTQIVQIESLFLQVLEIDSNNATANYNLAILYYNEGADIINELDYDLDLIAFIRVQDLCIELFLKGLPYMKKSYDLNYKRRETLVGLSNIYYGLSDKETSDFYKEELEKED